MDAHHAYVYYNKYLNADNKPILHMYWLNGVQCCGLSNRVIKIARDDFQCIGIRIDGPQLIFKFFLSPSYWDDPQELIADFFDTLKLPYVFDFDAWRVDETGPVEDY